MDEGLVRPKLEADERSDDICAVSTQQSLFGRRSFDVIRSHVDGVYLKCSIDVMAYRAAKC